MPNYSTQQIQNIVTAAAAKYGVDPNLALAVAKQESAFDPNAKSSVGAQGVMQLMPATAQSLGVTDPFDPNQNVDAGVRLLSQLLSQYNGNTALALAAYNAGPGNVAKYGGVPPFPETQNYVSSILASVGSTDSTSAPADTATVDSGETDQTVNILGQDIPVYALALGGTALALALVAYSLAD